MDIVKSQIKKPPIPFYIDTNLINARQSNDLMNYLEEKSKEEVIFLQMPETAHKEAMRHKLRDTDYENYVKTEYQQRKREGTTNRPMKATKYIYAIIVEDDLSTEHKQVKARIKEVLEQNSKEDMVNDAEIVFTAYYYRYILITSDGGSKKQKGGILRNRDQLKKEFGIEIMTPNEAVEYTKAYLGEL